MTFGDWLGRGVLTVGISAFLVAWVAAVAPDPLADRARAVWENDRTMAALFGVIVCGAMFAMFAAIDHHGRNDCRASARPLGLRWRYELFRGCQYLVGETWTASNNYDRGEK